jgi:hypothetical protein
MSGDRIPGSGTTAIPVYHCETCRDSGEVFAAYAGTGTLPQISGFTKCPDCDGRSRLCGEVDEPEETKS